MSRKAHHAGRSGENFDFWIIAEASDATQLRGRRPIGRAQTAPIQFQSDRFSSVVLSGLA